MIQVEPLETDSGTILLVHWTPKETTKEVLNLVMGNLEEETGHKCVPVPFGKPLERQYIIAQALLDSEFELDEEVRELDS